MTRMTGPDCVVRCNLINTYIQTYIYTYIHTYIHTFYATRIDPPEGGSMILITKTWHRMTRMTGPDCVVMCNLIHTYIHTYIHKYTYIVQVERVYPLCRA